MLEKIAAAGSNGRPNERLRALTQPHMPSSDLTLCAATNPVPASAIALAPPNHRFFARFLVDTHRPFQRRSTRHSDTSRIQDNSRFFSHLIFATRHLNATLASRHSNAKFQPVLHSLFFLFMLRTLTAFVFSGVAWQPAAPSSPFTEIKKGLWTRKFAVNHAEFLRLLK
jgi:hypothetical protein